MVKEINPKQETHKGGRKFQNKQMHKTRSGTHRKVQDEATNQTPRSKPQPKKKKIPEEKSPVKEPPPENMDRDTWTSVSWARQRQSAGAAAADESLQPVHSSRPSSLTPSQPQCKPSRKPPTPRPPARQAARPSPHQGKEQSTPPHDTPILPAAAAGAKNSRQPGSRELRVTAMRSQIRPRRRRNPIETPHVVEDLGWQRYCLSGALQQLYKEG